MSACSKPYDGLSPKGNRKGVIRSPGEDNGGTLHSPGYQNDNLEESIKGLLMDLWDERERHVGHQINQHKVKIQT